MGLNSKNTGAIGNNFTMSGNNVAGRDINHNYYSKEENNKIRCPYCNFEPETTDESGEITCVNCSKLYYEWRPTATSVSHFKNVPSESSQKYGDLIFQITAKIELGEFESAQKKCDDAINLSAKTPQGWEYLAYCYYLNTEKDEIVKNRAAKIIKYLDIAEKADPNSITLEKIKQTIAHKLYHFLRHKINRYNNLEKCRLKTIELITKNIEAWEICHEIYPSQLFLEQKKTYLKIIGDVKRRKEEKLKAERRVKERIDTIVTIFKSIVGLIIIIAIGWALYHSEVLRWLTFCLFAFCLSVFFNNE